MLLAGVGLGVCQEAGGIEAIVYFSGEILEHAGITSRTQIFAMVSM